MNLRVRPDHSSEQKARLSVCIDNINNMVRYSHYKAIALHYP